jgi:hypothetical protein
LAAGTYDEAYDTYDNYLDTLRAGALARTYEGNEVEPEFLMGLDMLMDGPPSYR